MQLGCVTTWPTQSQRPSAIAQPASLSSCNKDAMTRLPAEMRCKAHSAQRLWRLMFFISATPRPPCQSGLPAFHSARNNGVVAGVCTASSRALPELKIDRRPPSDHAFSARIHQTRCQTLKQRLSSRYLILRIPAYLRGPSHAGKLTVFCIHSNYHHVSKTSESSGSYRLRR